MRLTLGSLFTGVAGFDRGFELAGFETIWQVEKELFCIAVLKKHFPNVERYYEIKDCGIDRKHKLSTVDVVTAGFPCQDLSVAGKRAGLAGTRSGLFWEVIRLMGELRPNWLVLENVPGLFSSNKGRDFAVVLTELGKLGIFQSIAWTVLDSQFFRVAQRRRRVFIICGPRIGSAEQVLFESESSEGDFAQSGEARKRVARSVEDCIGSIGTRSKSRGYSADEAAAGQYIAHAISASAGHHGHSSPRGDGSDNLVTCLESGQSNASIGHGIVPNLTCLHEAPIINIHDVRGHRDKKQNGIGISSGEPCYTLDGTSQHAVAFALREDPGGIGQGWNTNFAVAATLNSGGNNGGFRTEPGEHLVSAPADPNGVRDFAGLPEGLDSARYRALGNAVTASVAQWIAERIRASHASEVRGMGRDPEGCEPRSTICRPKRF